ncbi:MAG: flagellar hook protein FlgE [Nitrosomonadales bacterium]|nr:flagellar hook protein FlgE [Nitrosomonadales bacterium]
MSFQQGLSGLNSSAKNLDSIGNNVANASTVGFKGSETQFADAYAASLSGGTSLQTGSGSRVAAVAQQFTQGNIATTNNPLDVAISGAGFFRMADPTGSVFYSRNGQFHEDKDGYIVNSLGHNVTGYEAALGVVAQVQPPVNLQISAIDKSNPPKVTSTTAVGVNLSSTEAGIDDAVTAFNPLTSTTYNKSTALAVYDSAGASHVASLYFQRIPITTFTPTTTTGALLAGAVSAPISSITGLSIGNTVTIAGAGAAGGLYSGTITAITAGVSPAGTLTFSPSITTGVGAGVVVKSDAGSLQWNVFLTVDGAIVSPPAVPAAPAAANSMAMMTFGNSGALITPAAAVTTGVMPWVGGAAITVDLTQCTQYAGTFNVNGLTQDGYAAGTLSGYSTSADGTILGRYTNGQTQALGQILLNNFSNPQGLQPIGNNEWVDTVAAGNLGPLTPGTSGRGVLQSSAVEDSNVDLTAELVNMIIAQRMYQANAQTIKAQDQVLQTIVNLK